MAAPKGRPKPAGSGRKKGTSNKDTAQLREMILQALDEQPGGGVEYLKTQAVQNPASFMTLLGKVLPTQITGAGGAPLQPPVINIGFGDGGPGQ